MPTPEHSLEIELSPGFHDLDPMDIVWHGNYVRYLELARCALLQTIDYDYPQMRESGYAWPVVDLRCKYVRPVRYGQRILVKATITEWENRLRMDYLVRDAETGDVIHRAHTLQVAVDLGTGEMCYASPPVLFERLGLAS